MAENSKYCRSFLRYAGGRIFFLLFFAGAALLSSGCTEYERRGINARPFNEPGAWEINPYGESFRN